MPRESEASPLGAGELNFGRLNFGRSWVGGAFCSDYRAGASVYNLYTKRRHLGVLFPRYRLFDGLAVSATAKFF